ncbi:MAG: DUF2231 domain-containing protein [Rubricoccaceae bacterium]|nr:DUF2231 domain-containing protein [Rubricoccaceae bacterium]
MGFDSVFQYEIPYLHPLVVHFPMVLLFLAAGGAAAYCLKGRALWRKAVLFFLALGAISARVAQTTGATLEESMEGTPIVDELAAYHGGMAKLTVYSSVLALLFVIALTVWLRKKNTRSEESGVRANEPLWGRIVLLVLVAFSAVVVAYTAHIGGVMVWGVPK